MTRPTSAQAFLRRLFENDRVADPELVYAEVALGLPVKPWWPPLAEVWRCGAIPSRSWFSLWRGLGRGARAPARKTGRHDLAFEHQP